MSSNDKTRQKLMESMRMTKADSSTKTEATEVKPQTKAAPKKAAKPAKKPAAKQASKPATDGYQSSQRVWPD